jgi:zinc/manganese transport system permease protein
MFTHEFVRNAYLAGTFIALACGVVGWLVVLRAQLFAGDALSHVAFVGAIGAAVVGIDERIGLFVLTLALAAVMAGLGRRSEADDVVIGITFAWILGLGVLALSLLATSSNAGTGISAANALFGQIYTLGAGPSRLAAVIGLGVTVLAAVGIRPLLLATLDPELAVTRGVPVRLLGAAFLLVLAVVTAESTQAVGALLLLGLLAGPAGAAHALTARPYVGVVLSATIAVGAMWGGLALSYAIPALPPSTAVIALAAATYAAATALTWRARPRSG